MYGHMKVKNCLL